MASKYGFAQDPAAEMVRRNNAAAKVQRDAAAAKQMAALTASRDDLIKQGVLPGALPQISDTMSPTDMHAANVRMQGIAQARSNAPATPAIVPASTSDPAPGKSQIVSSSLAGFVPGMPPVATAIAGAATAGVNAAFAAKPTPTPAPTATAPATARTPLETALATVPNHQGLTVDARQTGAGMVTTFPGSGGPHGFGARDIAVNPTFEQVMHAKTGGQWGTWTPQERASWLRSNPAPPPLNSDNAGVVTDPGRTAPDIHGVSTLQTPTGVAQEYDPRNDKVYSEGGVSSPGTVVRGIEARYGNGAAPGTIAAPPNPIPAAKAIPSVKTADATPAVPSAVDDKNDLGDFLQNEHDDQFKKGLVFQGFNDGVAV